MNSRSSVNETNLVNFSAELTTLNQLDTKDGLLSFPFDHIYACHSDTADRRSLQLEKEVEISTHCVVTEDKSAEVEVSRLSEKLAAAEGQNKRLKDLLIYHLDLIQQQNDLLSKREKLYQALRQENDSLKSKLNEKKLPATLRHTVATPVVAAYGPTSTVTSTVIGSETDGASQIMLNSFTELLLPDNRTNSYLFDGDLSKPKPFAQESFEIPRSSETDVTTFIPTDVGASILHSKLDRDKFTMIESKRSYVKKEVKSEPRQEALYTVTSSSGNPVIQRIQRNKRRESTGIGSLSRMSKSPAVKVELPESSKMFNEDKAYERTFSLNKKSKMISTYGKARGGAAKKTTHFTGSLSDRLQLIDTTPTGEDPYQLGEADMREQSPIPKLMLQKTNHGRMKICSEAGMTNTARRIYDAPATETSTKANLKIDRYNLSSTYIPNIKKEPKTVIVEEPDLDIVKTEPEIDWRTYGTSKPGKETSLCDFSYGENPNNLASHILPSLDSVEFQELFSTDALNLDNLNTVEYHTATENKATTEKTKKRGARATSLMGAPDIPPPGEGTSGSMPLEVLGPPVKRVGESKRGRKRAHSTTGLAKVPKLKPPQKPKLARGRAACRGKRSPVPGMMTRRPYHTQMGDPDLSWYLGLDPDLKAEDVDPPADCKLSTVEVPRWREKPYTSCYTMEGTENVDDRVFEKRHQKLEAEERRQLRWHMRRVREQRHVERLRQRQRASWATRPAVFSVWPRPLADARYIEITDTLPVIAFGEPMPDLPCKDFMLPWVRTSKALKRSKRSKTLH
ncbi:unnamed protein product [Parnassius apollo]|uniref:(apollo) hypothetical protein n=1 Tax=Parnassius apollo TaxID=110799 RepID=A0A8S3XAB1_PARAO|nr:unnamed protein product [Parnassius apollo]